MYSISIAFGVISISLELSPKTMELTPKLAEIEQTGKNPLTIQQEMFRDADKIF